MADVVLNLIYNDNNAQKNVDNLYRSLQQLENKHFRINVSLPDVQQSLNKLKELTNEIQRIQNIRNISLGTGVRSSFSELENILKNFESRLASAQQRVQELHYEMRGRREAGLEIDDSAFSKQIENAIDRVVWLKNAISDVKADIARADSKNGISSAINEANEAEQKFISSQKESEELTRKQEELQKAIAKANNDIAQGYHQSLRGVQQTVSGIINTITSAYSTIKSVVEAPLNLTGVSTFASMIESMEGSLLLNQISSNITTGFSMGLERFDILQTFPKVMESIGYSSDQSAEAMDRLYQSVLGLPTAFSDIVDSAKYFALVLGDLDKATDLAIAANNAFVASGANSQQISAGMRQLQYLIDGTKLRSTQWYSLIRAMPIALREVGTALGYPDFPSFTADLMGSKIATDTLIDTLIEVGLHSEKLGSIIGVMKSRVTAAMENVKNAAMRMGDAWLEALDASLQKTGGKNIAENIKGVSKILDHIASVGAQWISQNGDKIQALIDKFMSIDWASIIPKLFDGLVEFSDKAIDNIDKFLNKIPELITTVKQAFNDLENNPVVKALFGGISTFSGITQTIAGISNIVAGAKLTAAGKAIMSAAGATSSASLLGTAFGSIAPAVPYLAAILGAVISIHEVVKMDREEKVENEKFVNSDTTKADVRKGIQDYARLVSSLGTGLSGDDRDAAIYQINALSDRLYSNTGGKLVLPYIDAETTNLNAVLELANAYYRGMGYTSPTSGIGKLLQQRAQEDIILGENDGFVSSAMALYEDMQKAWDRFDNASVKYTDRLAKIDSARSRIQSMIEDLEKKGISWEIRTTSNFANIYGDPKGKEGKYFSEKIKESFGGLFRNTTSDFAQVQQELTPKITQLNRDMTKAIEGYDMPEAEKSQLYEAWATAISGIDPENPDSVAQLETMIKEGPDKLIKTYLIPLMESNEALNANKQALFDARMAALGLADEDLDKQAEYIEEKMAEDPLLSGIMKGLTKEAEKFSENYLPAINRGLINFGNDVRKSIENLINSINSWSFVAHPKVKVEPIKTTRAINDIGPQSGYYSATGGFMFAPHGTDTIPAMLTPGEYVQRRAAVEHFGRVFMDRINQLDLKGALRSLRIATPYSTGGFINNETRNYRDNHATVNQVFNNSSANYGFRRANRYVRALA